MASERVLPSDPLAFIRRCVHEKRIYWTYHVNMRLADRHIARQAILDAEATYEIIESYPEDKYLPSYLIWAMASGFVFHILFAADVPDTNVRVITAYRPDPTQWDGDFRRRLHP